MIQTRLADLPLAGSSHRFVGADHADTDVSIYFVEAAPGRGPGPHTHPYDEVAIVQSGRARWTVDGAEHEVGAGDVVVVKAGEVHGFTALGDAPLVQIDVHLSPVFVQHDLPG